MKVIGVEGSWSDDAVLTWGAAALKDGTTLINAVTGMKAEDSAESRRNIIQFPKSIEVSEGKPKIVLLMRNSASMHFNIEGSYFDAGNMKVFLFENMDSFNKARDILVKSLWDRMVELRKMVLTLDHTYWPKLKDMK